MYDNEQPNDKPDDAKPVDPWAAADLSYQADRERRERLGERDAIRRQNAYLRRAGIE